MEYKYIRFAFLILALFLSACQPGKESLTASVTALSGVTPVQLTTASPGSGRAAPPVPVVPVPTGSTLEAVNPAPGTPTPSSSPSLNPTPTGTPTPLPTLTLTPAPQAALNVLIVSCDTGIDLFNRLGEVTNAYVRVQNVGQGEASDVDVILEGSDEEKPHPDKQYHIDHLPPGYEIALKLTVDTRSGEETSIRVTVSSSGGISGQAKKDSCRSRRPDQDAVQKLGELFKAHPITTPTP